MPFVTLVYLCVAISVLNRCSEFVARVVVDSGTVGDGAASRLHQCLPAAALLSLRVRAAAPVRAALVSLPVRAVAPRMRVRAQ